MIIHGKFGLKRLNHSQLILKEVYQTKEKLKPIFGNNTL